ncbi:MAG: hypothetical protein ACYTEU_10075 [Planctomycetota bacterium]|jgi:hypothetical protein
MDLAGNPRPWDCPWLPNTDSGFDRGAFEFYPLQISLKITPALINCKSRGKDPMARLVFPAGIEIDPDVPVMLMSEKFAFTVEEAAFLSKKDRLTMNIPINRGIFGETFEDGEKAAISITGLLTDGRTFYGTDTIRIISK